MKIKCILVDDEPLAIEVLKAHIEKIGFLEITGCCQNALEAFELLNKKKADLMFLDIQMPGMKGTDFLRNLKNPPRVIITTAYREYALEGYDLDVVDYLVKPISFERLFKAVNKFLSPSTEPGVITLRENGEPSNPFIYIRINKKVHKIMINDIIYADSIKDYVTIHTAERKITAKHTLTAFEEILPDKEFLRIHRSYVVNIKKITGFTANTIDMPGIELPIGRNYKQQVFNALNYTSVKE
jgi:two-component system, LytTR family, response regulator